MIDVMFVTDSCGKCYICNSEDLNNPQHVTACVDQGSSAVCNFESEVGNSSFVHVFHFTMCGLQLISSGAASQVLFVHCKIVAQFEAGPICMICYLILQIVQAILFQ